MSNPIFGSEYVVRSINRLLQIVFVAVFVAVKLKAAEATL